MIGDHWFTSRFPLYCGLLLDTAAASARTVNGTTWRRSAHMISSNSPAVWLLRKVMPIDPDSSPPRTSRAPPESNVVTSFSSNSSVSSTLAHHSVRSLPLIDSWASSRTFLAIDLSPLLDAESGDEQERRVRACDGPTDPPPIVGDRGSVGAQDLPDRFVCCGERQPGGGVAERLGVVRLDCDCQTGRSPGHGQDVQASVQPLPGRHRAQLQRGARAAGGTRHAR